MDIEQQIQKAGILFQQQRFDEARKEYSLLLSSDPGNATHNAMLALCFLGLKKTEDAETYAKNAIGSDPSDPFNYYVAARVMLEKENLVLTKKYINEAISIDPSSSHFFALLASVFLQEKEWQKALDTAENGLALDAEDVECLNIRSTALTKLDRKEEAYDTISEALNQDPNNSYTHANLGWGFLEKSDHEKALHHFRQSLQLDPSSEWAKSGMIEALKARYWFYRLFLRYAFWIGNMKGKAQWGVLLGFYFGIRIIRAIAKSIPQLMPFLMPVIVLYIAFAITTWLITPISNLFLRLNVYGRYALDEEEIESSNYVGFSLLAGIIFGIAYLVFKEQLLVMISAFGLTIALPFSAMFIPAKKRNKNILTYYAFGMFFCGSASILLCIFAGADIYNFLTIAYLIGFVIFQWVANAMIID